MKILVVDDAEATVLNLCEYFELNNHECIAAYTVNDAIKEIFSYIDSIDIAILDIHFHGEEYGGFAIKRYLNSFSKKIPTIFITGLSTRELYSNSRELGSIALLHKPFDFNSLQVAIDLAKQYIDLSKSKEIKPIARITIDLDGEISSHLLSSTFTIGRGRNCTLTVPSYFELTSNLHCMLVRIYQELGDSIISFYRLVDGSFERSSSNGLFLNDKKLKRKVVDLEDGDVVRLPLFKKNGAMNFGSIYYELLEGQKYCAKSTVV